MRPRPRLPAFGLRSRIAGAILATAVVTLIVAAIALLGPLENSLRNAAMKTLQADLHGAVGSFSRLNYYSLPVVGPSRAAAKTGSDARSDLLHAQQQLAERIGAVDAVLGYPAADGRGQLLLSPASEGSRIESDPMTDAQVAFRTGHRQYSFGSIDGTEYARAAIPFKQGGLRYVLTVRKPIDTIPRAASAVRTAFLTAALVALALTLIIGIPLSARIVRRLRRLRHAALQLAREGPAVEVPIDRARDEVGDLARTFALMQRRLLQQEEARRAFVATASHELRTPLATLDGMLELLHEDFRAGTVDLEDAESLVERARVQSRRLGRLAADLLDLSRIDAQVDLRSEPVELGELSRAVLAEFELGTTERQIETMLDDRGGSVWALGDPGSVARILRILLDNALRHSPSGGSVRVELRNGSHASLSVTDIGSGVPPEERELIFQRFKRGRQTSGQAGFGLGLAIGRELATRMGGDLVLEPGDGPGAKFTLTLPVAKAPEEEPVAVG
jgi:signal transduction histidine kinase